MIDAVVLSRQKIVKYITFSFENFSNFLQQNIKCKDRCSSKVLGNSGSQKIFPAEFVHTAREIISVRRQKERL